MRKKKKTAFLALKKFLFTEISALKDVLLGQTFFATNMREFTGLQNQRNSSIFNTQFITVLICIFILVIRISWCKLGL